MIHIDAYDANDFYLQALKILKKHGFKTKPRGMEVIELLNVSVRIISPRKRVITVKDRNFPLKGAMAEFLWYMTQNNKISIITPYLKHWERYSDDGITVNSNYGYQWEDQIKGIIEKIRRDRDTRQAVVTLYDKKYSHYYGKDNVCTPSFQFLLRDDLLHLIVNARSRDLIRGECIDQFTFTYLQEIVANELNVDIGFYAVNIGSLHIYEDHFYHLDSTEEKNENRIFELTNIKYLQFWETLIKLNQLKGTAEENNIIDSIFQICKEKEINLKDFYEALYSRRVTSIG
jgi:thymidylate synthase